MRYSVSLASLAAALLGLSAPALAQPRAVPQPQPPGVGMIDDSCPDATGLWAMSPYVRENDWPWLCRFRADNAALAGKPVEAVFIGDSITEGWLRFSPALFSGGTVNRGISAQTSPQLLLRFMADVIALQPKVVHLMIGTNDIAGNTGPTTVQDYKNNIRAMADLARANNVRVVLGSIPPADHMNWKPELKPAARIAELNAWLKAFAAERGLVYADYYAAMVGPGGEMRAEFTEDGVHPIAAGYAAMEPVTRAALAAALKD